VVSNLVPIGKQTLTPAQYHQLADVPPEQEWLVNITNPKTRRFYKRDERTPNNLETYNCDLGNYFACFLGKYFAWDNVVLYGQYILDRKLVRQRRRAKRVVLSV
jgi:hypothetical protein